MAEQKTPVSEKITSQIQKANNILVALTSDPSVDEISAAIGLTLFLDSMGKHPTAIYSGKTPNALEFLQPEKTFEKNTNSLQDFIVALSKDKADHLRYNLDGDYVKIYITPYRTTISEEDLEFSHGDYNVDLVLALNVMAATDLDGALKEHGRIMHDATIINITTNPPGKFGEIEWSSVSTSSVSEMVTNLIYTLDEKGTIEKETATALLTGIVAATNRFSNERTTSETMVLAAKLMESGADQQLISANLTSDVSVKTLSNVTSEVQTREEIEAAAAPKEEIVEKQEAEVVERQTGMLDIPRAEPEPEPATSVMGSMAEQPAAPEVTMPVVEEGPKDYGKMIEEALAEPLPSETVAQPMGMPAAVDGQPMENPAMAMAPPVTAGPEMNNIPDMGYGQMPEVGPGGIAQPAAMGDGSYLVDTPRTVVEPISSGTANLPMPDETILPPPPAPPVDFGAVEPVAPAAPQMGSMPVLPQVQVEQPVAAQPETVAAQPAVTDPNAFQIPGM